MIYSLSEEHFNEFLVVQSPSKLTVTQNLTHETLPARHDVIYPSIMYSLQRKPIHRCSYLSYTCVLLCLKNYNLHTSGMILWAVYTQG